METHQALWGQKRSDFEGSEVSPALLASTWGSIGSTLSGRTPSQHQQWATMALYLDMLSRSLAQVVNILDPDMIVLGGGLSNMQCLFDELPPRMARYMFARDVCLTPILPPLGGDASGVFGAAALQ